MKADYLRKKQLYDYIKINGFHPDNKVKNMCMVALTLFICIVFVAVMVIERTVGDEHTIISCADNFCNFSNGCINVDMSDPLLDRTIGSKLSFTSTNCVPPNLSLLLFLFVIAFGSSVIVLVYINMEEHVRIKTLQALENEMEEIITHTV